jgi:hypothetical protein
VSWTKVSPTSSYPPPPLQTNLISLTVLVSLALLELRIILVKLFYCFDFELDTEVGQWDRANNVYLVWEKPQLPVKFTRRENVLIPGIDG